MLRLTALRAIPLPLCLREAERKGARSLQSAQRNETRLTALRSVRSSGRRSRREDTDEVPSLFSGVKLSGHQPCGVSGRLGSNLNRPGSDPTPPAAFYIPLVSPFE